MIAVGSKVKLKEDNTWLAKNYNLTIGKEYEVTQVYKYWDSVTIVNNKGNNATLSVERFYLS